MTSWKGVAICTVCLVLIITATINAQTARERLARRAHPRLHLHVECRRHVEERRPAGRGEDRHIVAPLRFGESRRWDGTRRRHVRPLGHHRAIVGRYAAFDSVISRGAALRHHGVPQRNAGRSTSSRPHASRIHRGVAARIHVQPGAVLRRLPGVSLVTVMIDFFLIGNGLVAQHFLVLLARQAE